MHAFWLRWVRGQRAGFATKTSAKHASTIESPVGSALAAGPIGKARARAADEQGLYAIELYHPAFAARAVEVGTCASITARLPVQPDALMHLLPIPIASGFELIAERQVFGLEFDEYPVPDFAIVRPLYEAGRAIAKPARPVQRIHIKTKMLIDRTVPPNVKAA